MKQTLSECLKKNIHRKNLDNLYNQKSREKNVKIFCFEDSQKNNLENLHGPKYSKKMIGHIGDSHFYRKICITKTSEAHKNSIN